MTRIILAHELLEAGVSKSHIVQRLGVSRRTINRWSQAIEKCGSLSAFLVYYQQAKKCTRRKRKVDAILKRRAGRLGAFARSNHFAGCKKCH
jgi:transposase